MIQFLLGDREAHTLSECDQKEWIRISRSGSRVFTSFNNQNTHAIYKQKLSKTLCNHLKILRES